MEWYNVFPEVPNEFHERVLTTLETRTKINNKKERVEKFERNLPCGENDTFHTSLIQKGHGKKMKLKSVLAFAAVIAALGIITAGAYTFINNWNPKMAEIFEADEQMQEKLTADGMSRVLGDEINTISAADNGVTMEVLQTLADKNTVYILLKFSSENEKLLDFEGFGGDIGKRISIEGYREAAVEDRYSKDIPDDILSLNIASTMIPDSMETVTDENGKTIHQFYHFIQLLNDSNQDYNGREVTVSFKDIGAYEEKLDGWHTLIEGTWEASWVLEYQDHTRVYELNKSVDVNGVEVIVKSVEISPLALNIVIDGDGARKLHENALLNYPILGTDDYADVGNIMTFMNFLPMLDNGEIFDGVSGMGTWGVLGDYISKRNFNKILDVERVTGIIAKNASYPEYSFEFTLD